MKPSIVSLLVAVAALAGCANLPGDPSKLSADQLRELSKDRSAMVSCTTVNTPWGPQRTVYAQMDKATFPSGRIVINTDCSGLVEADPKAPTPAAATTPR